MQTSPQSEHRLALNEATFRLANEAGAVRENTLPGERRAYYCECSSRSCAEQLKLTVAEYERVRTDPRAFFVKPGHEAAESETVVERGDRFRVVRKHPEVADLVERTDPRRGTRA